MSCSNPGIHTSAPLVKGIVHHLDLTHSSHTSIKCCLKSFTPCTLSVRRVVDEFCRRFFSHCQIGRNECMAVSFTLLLHLAIFRPRSRYMIRHYMELRPVSLLYAMLNARGSSWCLPSLSLITKSSWIPCGRLAKTGQPSWRHT